MRWLLNFFILHFWLNLSFNKQKRTHNLHIDNMEEVLVFAPKYIIGIQA